MEKKIIGFRKFNSKAGKPCCVVTLMSPYNDAQIQKGACGNQTEDIFASEAYHNLFNTQTVGKMAEIGYSVSGGRAYVDSITIK